MSSVLVIGGGLSGLSAAHTIYERGGNVTVLEKVSSSFRLFQPPFPGSGPRIQLQVHPPGPFLPSPSLLATPSLFSPTSER